MNYNNIKIEVTEIGEYIRFNSCERRLKLSFNKREEAKKSPFYGRFFNLIDPVLKSSGKKYEDEWEKMLKNAGYNPILPDKTENISWNKFLDRLKDIKEGSNYFCREVEVEEKLGVFLVSGRIDFIIINWIDKKPTLKIIEGKASRKDRTYHRIQLTLYKMLISKLIQKNTISINRININPEDIDYSIIRKDNKKNSPQDITNIEPIKDLKREISDINYLVSSDGPFAKIIKSNLEQLQYQLNVKCDDCTFNTHCFTHSSLDRKIELLSQEPSIIRILMENGIKTIDDLANLDLRSQLASNIRSNIGFSINLDLLKNRAEARRSTLPRGENDPDSYEVKSLPTRVQSQLPEHNIKGRRLIRIYLNVDYDYIENRIAGLSAHITNSDFRIKTKYDDPFIKEVNEQNNDEREIQGEDLIEYIREKWDGQYEIDNGREKQLIQTFFYRLIEKISIVADSVMVPIHFYVWSRKEIKNLIEGCSRTDSNLLSHLRELMGCRESLDQLIYSCLEDECVNRYALGWTGRGLSVITSLKWYGERYYWTRMVNNKKENLEEVFNQDIFDFKTSLNLNISDNSWASNVQEDVTYKHKYEIRSRFSDSLTAPYWYANWNEFDKLSINDKDVIKAIKKYKGAGRVGYLNEYLKARVHALRWIEERIRYKNNTIDKPLLNIEEIKNFSLNVNNTVRSAIDFLRLDHHVKLTDWYVKCFNPPINRVSLGLSIPITEISYNKSEDILRAIIDLANYDITIDILSTRCSFGNGSFIRITPYNEPNTGQTIKQLNEGGYTCKIINIDWDNGSIILKPIPYMNKTSRYVLYSNAPREENFYDFAIIDDNVSDFVSARVEDRLSSTHNYPTYQWFDPHNPIIPENNNRITESDLIQYKNILGFFRFGDNKELKLQTDQINSIIEGLNSKIQILQGPPGTGKTLTTALIILLKITQYNNSEIIVLSANTHTAVDNLLERILFIKDVFYNFLDDNNIDIPSINIAKIHSSKKSSDDRLGINNIINIPADSCTQKINNARKNNILILGSTPGTLLKMISKLSSNSYPNGLQSNLLVIDEASMMVFPYFLSLTTLICEEGQIFLTGDHRQLEPIVAHDWENEDRPPVLYYQPYVSSYQAIRNITDSNSMNVNNLITLSSLNYTFRLPNQIIKLLAKLYELDKIKLEGIEQSEGDIIFENNGSWEQIWKGKSGLFLVIHTENNSRQCNEYEIEIINNILKANKNLPNDSVAIITPYRAQRSLINRNLDLNNSPVGIIDTVERLQGGEKDNIIVSAVASDISSIVNSNEFILNLNRSNVAFSRSKKRLIVICSENLINYIPTDIEQYDSAMLWKSLKDTCARIVGNIKLNGYNVKIRTVMENNNGV